MKRVVCQVWINRQGQFKDIVKHSLHLTQQAHDAFVKEHENDPEIMARPSYGYITEVDLRTFNMLVNEYEKYQVTGLFFTGELPAKAPEVSYEG